MLDGCHSLPQHLMGFILLYSILILIVFILFCLLYCYYYFCSAFFFTAFALYTRLLRQIPSALIKSSTYCPTFIHLHDCTGLDFTKTVLKLVSVSVAAVVQKVERSSFNGKIPNFHRLCVGYPSAGY